MLALVYTSKEHKNTVISTNHVAHRGLIRNQLMRPTVSVKYRPTQIISAEDSQEAK